MCSWDVCAVGTFPSKDPALVHAGGEEGVCHPDTHQQICDHQVNDKQVGRRPQAAAPVTHTLFKSRDLDSSHTSGS